MADVLRQSMEDVTSYAKEATGFDTHSKGFSGDNSFKTKAARKRSVNFNHISDKLVEGDITKLKKWYAYYHMLATCYRWKHKKLKRVHTTLSVVSVVMTAAGAGLSAINIAALAITGVGVVVQGLLNKTDLSRKVEQCKFAYTYYEKILVGLKTYLRGMPFDEEVLLTEMKVLDDIIIDMVPIGGKLVDRYKKTFTTT